MRCCPRLSPMQGLGGCFRVAANPELVRYADRNRTDNGTQLGGAEIAMYVRDLMQTEVVTLNAGDTLDLADDIMRLGRIRHMPITADGKLVGILSQRDLFRAAISSVLQLRPAAEREWLAKIAVREAMTTKVCTIAPGASAHEAVKLMLEKRIGCVPVVEDENLVGLLSESDCMRYLARLLDISDVKHHLPELPQPD